MSSHKGTNDRAPYTKKQLFTDSLLSKGHGHPVKRSEPQLCPDCKGMGCLDYSIHLECETCQGEGEI